MRARGGAISSGKKRLACTHALHALSPSRPGEYHSFSDLQHPMHLLCLMPDLSYAEPAPCGAERGIVASRRVSSADLETQPLITIPRSLQFDGTQASSLLVDALLQRWAHAATPSPSSASRQQEAEEAVASLSAMQQVAVALAHERSKGSSSEWGPYMRSLPAQPPNPWLLEDEAQVAQAVAQALATRHATSSAQPGQSAAAAATAKLASQGLDWMPAGVASGSQGLGQQGPGQQVSEEELQQQWQQAVREARAEHEEACREALEACGSALGLSKADVLWGMGQVRWELEGQAARQESRQRAPPGPAGHELMDGRDAGACHA